MRVLLVADNSREQPNSEDVKYHYSFLSSSAWVAPLDGNFALDGDDQVVEDGKSGRRKIVE